MIRDYRASDIDQILAIWLSASIKAHDFIESAFWESKINEMREVYIPASDTFVYEVEGEIVGFYSLYQDTLAAIFILPNFQGKGLGSILLDDAKKGGKTYNLLFIKKILKASSFMRNTGLFYLLSKSMCTQGTPNSLWSIAKSVSSR